MKKANFISNFEPLNLNLKKKFGRRQTYFARNVEMNFQKISKTMSHFHVIVKKYIYDFERSSLILKIPVKYLNVN